MKKLTDREKMGHLAIGGGCEDWPCHECPVFNKCIGECRNMRENGIAWLAAHPIAEAPDLAAEVSRLRALLAEARDGLRFMDDPSIKRLRARIDAELSPEGKGGEDGV